MSSNNPYGNGAYGGVSYGSQTTTPNSPTSQQATSASSPGQPALSGFGAGAPVPADLIKDTTTATFSADVLQESRNQPVLVDFWAPWCGPCRQLTPIIEKVVRAAGGKVKLVKMNIDEHPAIAGQLGIQSIPAVFAFAGGQPVDGFMGALPESEVKAFVDRLTQGKGGREQDDPIAAAMVEAGELLAAGDAEAAAELYGAVVQHAPDNIGAMAGLAECYLAAGDTARAKAVAEQAKAVAPGAESDPALSSILAKLKLAEEIAQLGDPVLLQARIEGDPDDHEARYDLALIAQAMGDRDTAAGHLLEIIRRDRGFKDDGARQKLLEFFDAWGPTDPATKEARRRLSSVLFS